MIIPESAERRIYGEADGKRGYSIPFSDPVPVAEENAFYGPRFSMSAQAVPQPVVYVSSGAIKAGFGFVTVYYGGMQQEEVVRGPSSPPGYSSSAGIRDGKHAAAATIDEVLAAIRSAAGMPTLESVLEAARAQSLSWKEEGAARQGREGEGGQESGLVMDVPHLLLSYVLPQKGNEQKGQEKAMSYSPPQRKGTRWPGELPEGEEGSGIPDGKARLRKKKLPEGAYGKQHSYGIPEQGKKDGKEDKYDFRQVWNNIEVNYSFSIGKNDNPFSHYIDYDSLRPKTHGSAIIAAKSYYNKVRREMSSFASFEGHFN